MNLKPKIGIDDIEENIQCFKQIELELKSDVDEILDVINGWKIVKKTKEVHPKVLKEINVSLKVYKKLLDQYSLLLVANDESIKKAEGLKKEYFD